MAAAVIEEFRQPVGVAHPISSIVLVPHGKGVFDVSLDGDTVFSKQLVGRHADHEEIFETIKSRISV